jgi:hypothetical protein
MPEASASTENAAGRSFAAAETRRRGGSDRIKVT